MADSTASSKSSDTAGTALTTATFGDSRERKIVLLLCALAAIHVFVFSAAFPLFNNVDEAAHFDLVLKYSRGDLPQGIENLSPAVLISMMLAVEITTDWPVFSNEYNWFHLP